MKGKNNCLKEIDLALVELDKFINDDSGLIASFSNIGQLMAFKKVLLSVMELVRNDNLPPKNERYLGIGRVVVDQWPHELNLGSLLISAEHAYREM